MFQKSKHAEGSPLESKEHLRILIESAKDHAIYTMDADGRIDYWNTGAQALFGYTESEIIGQSATRSSILLKTARAMNWKLSCAKQTKAAAWRMNAGTFGRTARVFTRAAF